jgi:hypothetical protein
MHTSLRPLALTLLITSLATVSPAAPFPVTGVGNCPSGGSGITDPLAICTFAFGFNGPSFDTEVGFPTGSGGENQSATGSQASGSAVIDSDLGDADFLILADKTGTTSFGVADVTGEASWSDTVTIDSPGLTGQSGTFRATMFLTLIEGVETNLGSALSAFSDVVYRMEVVTNGTGWGYFGEIGIFESTMGVEIRDQGDPPGQFVTGDLGFIFGTPFDLDIESRIVIEASVNGGDGTAITSAVANVVWLGFDEVRLTSGGALVTDYTLTSGTGEDWSQPLPEPGSFGLAAGLVALAGLSRWRARKAA